MPNENLSRLTDKEREALRLVHRRLTSKEIAPLLGVRVDAVDARIKNATRKLGISDRGKAALLLADFEAQNSYPQQVYQSPEIVGAGEKAMLREPAARSLNEERAPFHIDTAPAAETPVSVRVEETNRVQLSSWQRLCIIGAIAIGTIVALSLLISFLNGLVQLSLTQGRLF